MHSIRKNENNAHLENTSPPSWFSAFETRLANKLDNSTEFLLKLIAKTKTDIQSELDSIRQNLNFLKLNRTLVDECEIKVSGIPYMSSLNPLSILNSVLVSCGLANISKHVMSWRNWNHANNSNTMTMVFKLTSPAVRNLILKHSSNLINHDSQSIFGQGGNAKVYISALWPKATYNLLRKAQEFATRLKYASPVVRNLIVCMRKTKEKASPLIPIISEADLLLLKPLDFLHSSTIPPANGLQQSNQLPPTSLTSTLTTSSQNSASSTSFANPDLPSQHSNPVHSIPSLNTDLCSNILSATESLRFHDFQANKSSMFKRLFYEKSIVSDLKAQMAYENIACT